MSTTHQVELAGYSPSAVAVDAPPLQDKTNIPGVASSKESPPGSSRTTPIKLVIVNNAEEMSKHAVAAKESTAENNNTNFPTFTTKNNPARGKRGAQFIDNDDNHEDQDPIFRTKRTRKPTAATTNVRTSSNLRSSSKAPASSPPEAYHIPAITLTPAPTYSGCQLVGESMAKSTYTNGTMLAPPRPTQIPPFCCSSILAVDQNALWNSPDNGTCTQRHIIILLNEELKSFGYSLPIASTELLQEAKYMVQVTKYIPSAADQIALVSASRVKISASATEKNKWEIDTAGGVKGRFFIEAERKEGVVIDDEEGRDIPIWAEVEGMAYGERLTRGWEMMEKSVMEYMCVEHREEKWICVYWKAKA